MAYYIFVRSIRPPSGWELLEAINHPRIAKYALSDYQEYRHFHESCQERSKI